MKSKTLQTAAIVAVIFASMGFLSRIPPVLAIIGSIAWAYLFLEITLARRSRRTGRVVIFIAFFYALLGVMTTHTLVDAVPSLKQENFRILLLYAGFVLPAILTAAWRALQQGDKTLDWKLLGDWKL